MPTSLSLLQRSIIKTWQTQAVGLRQIFASSSALATSSANAWTVATREVPALSGHGGEQSAHACGAGNPPSRELRSKSLHFFWQSPPLLHVTGRVVLPLISVSSTSVRGNVRLDSDIPMSVM